MRKRYRILAALLLAGALAGTAAFYVEHGLYGFNVLLRRGGTHFVIVKPDDARLSASMRAALGPVPPNTTAAAPAWHQHEPGLETAELPVVAGDVEVDRLLLTRIDPAHFRFAVLTASDGNAELADWLAKGKPAVVINGSYFDRRGYPDTPLKSAGMVSGPSSYSASHGLFSVSPAGDVAISDLRTVPWRPLFDKARDAMVSYPLLMARNDSPSIRSDRRWLANRSFVAQEQSGRIVLGTTKEAFFSLERLATFLRSAPLDLTIALNLDGGPLACHAVRSGSYERDFCGDWETQTKGDDILLLQRVFGTRRWALPIVLAAFPKAK